MQAFGWREDQSCLKNSLYVDGSHPALSSTVLLRRKVNNEPALIYYPYGEGTVILTSMFTDWGLAHSQASSAELKLVRDLVTFAKNPQSPTFNFPDPQKELNQPNLHALNPFKASAKWDFSNDSM